MIRFPFEDGHGHQRHLPAVRVVLGQFVSLAFSRKHLVVGTGGGIFQNLTLVGIVLLSKNGIVAVFGHLAILLATERLVGIELGKGHKVDERLAIGISRRTVTKYREKLGILSTSKRKER